MLGNDVPVHLPAGLDDGTVVNWSVAGGTDCRIAVRGGGGEEEERRRTYGQAPRAVGVGGGIRDFKRPSRVLGARARSVDARVENDIRGARVDQHLEVLACADGEVREPEALFEGKKKTGNTGQDIGQDMEWNGPLKSHVPARRRDRSHCPPRRSPRGP